MPKLIEEVFYFLYEKWGDLVALSILVMGVIMVFHPAVKETGSGLIMASLGLLKLTKTYRTNGGNNGNQASPKASG